MSAKQNKGQTIMNLLDEFIGEYVNIVTKMKVPMSNGEGDTIEMLLTFEGTFVSYDDEYILIEPESEPIKLICRNEVGAIEVIDETASVMTDPSKPTKRNMN